MGWQLASNVTFCIASNRAIFLDVARDRYTRLPEQLNGPFVRWILGDKAAEYQDAAAMLEREHLLERAEDDVAPMPCRFPAARSSLSPKQPSPAVAVLASIRFGYALRRARHRLARRGLLGALSHVVMTREARSARRDPRAIASALVAVGAALGYGEDCLVRSLALVDCLHQTGSDGTVVFGVLAMPFGAHCWVQAGDLVLNDQVDRVSLFTPIVAL